ncbi:MAG TPA: HAD family hydrolase, partial [Chloroflexota bacterium]|nr:HAD family hydrolase [Chloroflexota bacterium]
MREIRAVIFDLYGTLIGEPPFEDLCFPLLAEAIGISRDVLARVRDRSVEAAMTGRLATAEDRARVILRDLGRADDDSLVERLATIEREVRWPAVKPYPATVPTLTTLRAQGVPIGLVSDCTGLMGRPLVERLGLSQFFDAIALSHEVGYAKPAAEIYHAAIDRLGVEPGDCLYVGDGASDELNGAKALGMTTV